MSPLEGVAKDRLRAEARGRRPLSRRSLYETYMIMLACRGKKLTDEEREYTKVGSRGEMIREELIRCKGGLKQEWNFDRISQLRFFVVQSLVFRIIW